MNAAVEDLVRSLEANESVRVTAYGSYLVDGQVTNWVEFTEYL